MTNTEIAKSQSTEVLEAMLAGFANRHPGATPLSEQEISFKYAVAAELDSRCGRGWWSRFGKPQPRKWRGR